MRRFGNFLTWEQLFSIWAIFYRRPRPFLSPIDQCWCKKFQPHGKLTTFCSWTCHQHVKFAVCMGVLGWSHSLCGLRSHQLFWVKAQKRASLSSNNPCTQIPRVHSRHRRLCQLFTLCWWEEELLYVRERGLAAAENKAAAKIWNYAALGSSTRAAAAHPSKIIISRAADWVFFLCRARRKSIHCCDAKAAYYC